MWIPIRYPFIPIGVFLLLLLCSMPLLKQRHYNRMSEVYPNIKGMLREALNLPTKMYGGGSVRPTRSY